MDQIKKIICRLVRHRWIGEVDWQPGWPGPHRLCTRCDKWEVEPVDEFEVVGEISPSGKVKARPDIAERIKKNFERDAVEERWESHDQ